MTTNDPTPLHPDRPEGEQGSYLPPDVPEGYVHPPSDEQFANATWLPVGPEIKLLIDEVLGTGDFDELLPLSYFACWRRRTTPKTKDDEPVFASVEVIAPRILWVAEQSGMEGFPRYFLDLPWQHFQNMREDSTYVHNEMLQQAMHFALCSLAVDNGRVLKEPPDVSTFVKNVARYGLHTEGLRRLQQPFAQWAQAGTDEGES